MLLRVVVVVAVMITEVLGNLERTGFEGYFCVCVFREAVGSSLLTAGCAGEEMVVS